MAKTSRSILVVDDEEIIRKGLTRTLQKEGYRVVAASGPDEALALLAREELAIVISDHLMPKVTGLEFLKIVRNRYPNCLRMMLTGHADIEVAVQAINQGEVYRLVTKPWDDAELKSTLYMAFEMLDFERERRQLASMVGCRQSLARSLDALHSGIGSIRRDSDGAILLEDPLTLN